MSTIDDLLAQSLLLPHPHVPADVVPYQDGGDDDLLPWDSYGDEAADPSAAQSLAALCEVVVTHSFADQLADFLTDQVPQPRTARILGCVLHLAGADTGARFWWQYAAGAEDTPASYCLYLQHLAHGDPHAAALWQTQAGAYAPTPADPDPEREEHEHAPALQMMTADASLTTVLRILSHLTRTTPSRPTAAARAVIEFVASAVAGGYLRHPDLELPLPGQHFAEQLEIVIAAVSSPRKPARPTLQAAADTPAASAAQELPSRLAPDNSRKRVPTKTTPHDPEQLLVEVSAPTTDHEPTPQHALHTFFERAAAVCWKTATAAGGIGTETRGNRMAYRLRRFAHRYTPAPSGFNQPRSTSASGTAQSSFHRL
ncbi:hypothetical protein ABT052_29210 [Streptomyces sp. NPDC002766]|uniref:hypothetical protein n=1 Tax=Streptomyces sp. NPDC002766 TaxID=3154429 RepID=UPI0033212AC8